MNIKAQLSNENCEMPTGVLNLNEILLLSHITSLQIEVSEILSVNTIYTHM